VEASDLAGVAELALGDRHSCARRRDGHVACWGFNVSGQLGNGLAKDSSTPVLVEGLDDAVAIAAGDWHTCALVARGGVVCWGENERGSLGDRTHRDRVTPTRVELDIDGAIAIAAYGFRTCVLDASRRLTCWGDDLDAPAPAVVP
jgi:alpha-tubulin suppressor-like RCC1 family protein